MNSHDLIESAIAGAVRTAEGPCGSTENMVRAAIHIVAIDLRAMLHPELYPGYDPDHIFWDGFEEDSFEAIKQGSLDPGAFQWSADTTEWCSEWAQGLYEATLPKETG